MTAQLFLSATILSIALLVLDRATSFQISGNTRQAATSLNAVSRRQAFAASASAAMITSLPLEALAGQGVTPTTKPDFETASKLFYNGVFRDMKNPKGYRVVAGVINKAGSVIMRDTLDGEEFEIPMMAKKDEATGQITLDMDLSAYRKDFSSSVVATVKKDGLYFPDGNVWKKEKGVVGVYIDGFAPYPKYRRVVLPSKEGNVAVTMVSGKKIFDAPGLDLGNKGLQVDFPGKQCTGKFNNKQGTITWADGNVWTKI